MIQFRCPICSKKFRAPDSRAGAEFACTGCTWAFDIPAVEDPEEPALPAPPPVRYPRPVEVYEPAPVPSIPPPMTVYVTHAEPTRPRSAFGTGFGLGCGAYLGWFAASTAVSLMVLFLFCAGIAGIIGIGATVGSSQKPGQQPATARQAPVRERPADVDHGPAF